MAEKRYIDTETGECVSLSEILRQAVIDRHSEKQRSEWLKLFVKEIDDMKDIVDSKKFVVVLYLLQNMSFADNAYKGSADDIRNATGVSRPTVLRTMSELQSRDYIRQIRRAHWMVNPRKVLAGTAAKEDVLAERYFNLAYKKGAVNDEYVFDFELPDC